VNLQKRIARRVKNIGIDQIKAVWDSPATFNRHDRRAAGVLGRLWRWDPLVLDPDRGKRPPRYVRRNYPMQDPTEFTAPRTRRQRKVKASIMRMMKGRLA